MGSGKWEVGSGKWEVIIGSRKYDVLQRRTPCQACYDITCGERMHFLPSACTSYFVLPASCISFSRFLLSATPLLPTFCYPPASYFQRPASRSPLATSCFLLPASRFLLPPSSFLLPLPKTPPVASACANAPTNASPAPVVSTTLAADWDWVRVRFGLWLRARREGEGKRQGVGVDVGVGVG